MEKNKLKVLEPTVIPKNKRLERWWEKTTRLTLRKPIN